MKYVDEAFLSKVKHFDLYNQIKAYIEENRWFQEKDALLVALSGGVDSVVLLHLLRRLAQEWHLRLIVGHVNHQLRGAESDEDERFVRQLCRQWHLSLLVRRVDVASYRRQHKMGLEEAARAVRYAALEQWAEEHRCRWIALGHTADDQVETVLMQLLRGAGISGLRGIPAQRQKIIRPLLKCSRKDIENYALEHNLQWRHDRSNDDLSLTRNRIRHQLLPLLRKEYQPRIETSLMRLAEIMAEADIYLRHQAEQALQKCILSADDEKIILDIERYLSYFDILKKYMLRLAVGRLQGDEPMVETEKWLSFWQFVQARRPQSPLRWHRGWEIWRWRNQIAIVKSSHNDHRYYIDSSPCRMELTGGYLFEIKPCAVTLNSIKSNDDQSIAYVDGELLHFPLLLRRWHREDRFRPLGMHHDKSVAEFLKDAQVPNYLRANILILESSGAIVWICGHRLDERFKVTENSKSILQLRLIKHAAD